MSKHNETGIKGEQIAIKFLLKKSYNILHSNWRFGKKEIDIIAKDNNTLVFIEVKTRRSLNYGYPEEAVNMKKQSFMKIAADAYSIDNPDYDALRFDVISVILEKDEVKESVHFEDAFY